ncbi:unnamed protein product [Cylicocyclus nassatus]|uniref:Uncharacterized protein n=1 Tax=Cylicocyclus nassatus TaxID=53992 RepID=A0AA36GGW9_CYLNA|nr:unnamed protein product [Cylicocyclus nassatus]
MLFVESEALEKSPQPSGDTSWKKLFRLTICDGDTVAQQVSPSSNESSRVSVGVATLEAPSKVWVRALANQYVLERKILHSNL